MTNKPTKFSEEDLARLLEEAKSPDADVRFEAVAELELYHSPEVDETLVQATEDPDQDVASRALEELAERGHPKARELILKHFRSKKSLLRWAALRSAGVVDISPHLEPAWQALDKRRWVDRMAGAAALAMAGVVAALPRIRALAERARAVQDEAAEAHLLGSAALLGDYESADSFLALLQSRRRMSRLAAAAFLERRARLEQMVAIVGKDQLRDALVKGKQVQEQSSKPRIARRFDELLDQLGG